jgi:hypothetical protein
MWFPFGLGVGWFTVALFDLIKSWRQQRRDRHNIETMAKIKERMFNDPYPFGIPLIESDLVPDDKIYVVNPDYLYVDGKPAELLLNKNVKARIQNLKDGT